MPLSAVILSRYVNPVFVETGTLRGDGVRLACALPFKVIHSIELMAERAVALSSVFKSDRRVSIWAGDSATILPVLLADLNQDITFWLDAHPPGKPLPLSSTPLLSELKAVAAWRKNAPKQGAVVLIDDMRIFSEADRQLILAEVKTLAPVGIFSCATKYGEHDILGATCLPTC